jgi:hypothetical protein
MEKHPINRIARLPENVFEGKWSVFLFFDPDWIFCPEFIGICQSIISKGNDTWVEITDLETPASSFRIDRTTIQERYQQVLSGHDCKGWIYLFGRFAISASTQKWCIYLERDAEIAIFASKPDCPNEINEIIIHNFKALPIMKMVATQGISAFDKEVVSDEYIEKLIESFSD